jgi:hypothetical protein
MLQAGKGGAATDLLGQELLFSSVYYCFVAADCVFELGMCGRLSLCRRRHRMVWML